MLDLFEFEAVPDAVVGGVGGEAGAEAATPTAEPATVDGVGTPSPEAPAAPAWSPDDPAFLDAVDARAAEVLDMRLQTMQQQQPAAAPALPGEPVDWNEMLNPLSDDYGTNLVQLLQQRDQYILEQMRELQAPVLSRYEQESLAEGEQRIADIIQDDFARNGAIEVPAEFAGKVDPVQTIKEIAPVFMQQFEGRYGKDSARAAEAALSHATSLVRSVYDAGAKVGENRYRNQMATLNGAPAEPGSAGAALHSGPPAQSVDEAIARAFQRPEAA